MPSFQDDASPLRNPYCEVQSESPPPYLDGGVFHAQQDRKSRPNLQTSTSAGPSEFGPSILKAPTLPEIEVFSPLVSPLRNGPNGGRPVSGITFLPIASRDRPTKSTSVSDLPSLHKSSRPLSHAPGHASTLPTPAALFPGYISRHAGLGGAALSGHSRSSSHPVMLQPTSGPSTPPSGPQSKSSSPRNSSYLSYSSALPDMEELASKGLPRFPSETYVEVTSLALTLSERRPPGSLVLLINDEVRASQVIPASDEIDYVWDLPEPLLLSPDTRMELRIAVDYHAGEAMSLGSFAFQDVRQFFYVDVNKVSLQDCRFPVHLSFKLTIGARPVRLPSRPDLCERRLSQADAPGREASDFQARKLVSALEAVRAAARSA